MSLLYLLQYHKIILHPLSAHSNIKTFNLSATAAFYSVFAQIDNRKVFLKNIQCAGKDMRSQISCSLLSYYNISVLIIKIVCQERAHLKGHEQNFEVGCHSMFR